MVCPRPERPRNCGSPTTAARPIRGGHRIFCFGVGYDVNPRLLDRLSGGNSGTSEYVKPDEDIETHVGRFYSKMTSPVLADLRIELAGIDVNRTYPRDLPDLFEGGQIVWVGRYRQSGPTTLRITGKVGGERRSLEFSADLAASDRVGGYEFVERIWATRRVGYLIDQIDLSGQNRELIDELVRLSTRYGILTPYTSFLADERVQLHAARVNEARTTESLSALNATSGGYAVAQRDLKQNYMRADRPLAESMDGAGLASAPRRGGMAGMGGYGGMMGGMGGGGRAFGRAAGAAAPAQRPGGPSSFPALAYPQPETERGRSEPSNLRQIGAKTFYFKDKRWIDSTVKPEEEARAKVIRQFSDEFFKLARSQSAEMNQYLTFAEPVTLRLDGTVYRIEAAESKP